MLQTFKTKQLRHSNRQLILQPEDDKAQLLVPEQEAELRELQELDRIFTLLNAKFIADA